MLTAGWVRANTLWLETPGFLNQIQEEVSRGRNMTDQARRPCVLIPEVLSLACWGAC